MLYFTSEVISSQFSGSSAAAASAGVQLSLIISRPTAREGHPDMRIRLRMRRVYLQIIFVLFSLTARFEQQLCFLFRAGFISPPIAEFHCIPLLKATSVVSAIYATPSSTVFMPLALFKSYIRLKPRKSRPFQAASRFALLR